MSFTALWPVFFARETNLKVRQALPETAEMEDSLEQLTQFNGMYALYFYIFFVSVLHIFTMLTRSGNLNMRFKTAGLGPTFSTRLAAAKPVCYQYAT